MTLLIGIFNISHYIIIIKYEHYQRHPHTETLRVSIVIYEHIYIPSL